MTLGGLQQPPDRAKSAELEQRRLDDRRSLDAAVSEGWSPLLPSTLANAKPRLSYRTGAQTWQRRKTAKTQS
jgi:hypothetical protein